MKVEREKTVCFDNDLFVFASRDAPLSRLHSYQDMYHHKNIEKLNCRRYKKINHHTCKDKRDWSHDFAKPTSARRSLDAKDFTIFN